MLRPEYMPIREYSPLEQEAIRQKIHDDYLPTYIDVTGLVAYRAGVAATTKLPETFVLSGFWKITNDRTREACDGGLMKLHREPTVPASIAYVQQDPPWPEIPGSEAMVLMRPPMLTLADLYIRERDLIAPAAERENPHAQRREECLRAALCILADSTSQHDLRAQSSGKVQAVKLRHAIEREALRFWPATGAPPLSAKVIDELLNDAMNGKMPNKKGKIPDQA